MPNQTQTLLRNATRQSEVLNIITAPTHERNCTGIARTGHNFYSMRGWNFKDWNTTYAPVPKNYTLLDPNKKEHQLPPWIEYDIVLSQNRFGQHQVFAQLARQLGLPLIALEHTLPVPTWTNVQRKQLRQMAGKFNVFISEFSAKAWGFDLSDPSTVIIEHGIDTELFCPVGVESQNSQSQPYILSIVNDWVNRDWCCGFTLWRNITGFPDKKLIPTRVVGNTPGLSKPASSTEELVLEYNNCTAFLNTATFSPVPTALMEAMSCGKPVVSTINPMVQKVVRHGTEGFLSNDANELRNYCKMLLSDTNLAQQMGAAARKRILEDYPLEKVIRKWNELFSKAVEE